MPSPRSRRRRECSAAASVVCQGLLATRPAPAARLRSVAAVEPSRELLTGVTRLTGARPVRWVARAGGFTPTERWSLDLADGRWVFAKRATQDWLADALRAEYRILGLIDADFRCEVVGWQDGERPLLVLEDISTDQISISAWHGRRRSGPSRNCLDVGRGDGRFTRRCLISVASRRCPC